MFELIAFTLFVIAILFLLFFRLFVFLRRRLDESAFERYFGFLPAESYSSDQKQKVKETLSNLLHGPIGEIRQDIDRDIKLGVGHWLNPINIIKDSVRESIFYYRSWMAGKVAHKFIPNLYEK